MATYLMLIQFTEQGVRNIKHSPQRAVAAQAAARKLGVKVTDILWTLGPYDGALLAEAPDDETMTAFALSVSSLGFIRTRTLRAFRAKEFAGLLRKLR